MSATQQLLLAGNANLAAGILGKLAAWWDFEENAAGTQFLDSHSTHHLDLINSGTTSARSNAGGKVDRASSWPNANSSDGGQIPRSNSAFDFAGAFTIGCWVYFNEMPTDDVTRFLLGRLGGLGATQINYALMVSTLSGSQKLQFSIRNSTDSTSTSILHTTGSPLTTATWYFAVLCHDPSGSQFIAYVNNVKTISSYSSGVYSAGASNFSVAQGRRSDTTNLDTARTIGCRIDGAFAWPGIVSDDEVNYLYNAGAGKNYAALVSDA